MPTEDVILRVRLVGQEAAAAGLGKVADQTRRVGTESAKSAKGGVGKMSGAVKGMVASAAGMFAVSTVTKDAIGNAVNLGEQINKTAVVFRGPGSKAIQDWSKTTAESLGISQRQALESTGVFGNMLVPMGVGRTRAAELSKHMVTLASDMASFNNASPEETLDALRAGLAGETEPLRRYGVFLNQARIEQVAMKKGLWDGKGAIDAHAKALATAAIITHDTKDAHGDFARTSKSLANQQRILRARYEEITAQIGKHLIPVLSFLTQHMTETVVAIGLLTSAWVAYKVAANLANIQTALAGVRTVALAVASGVAAAATGVFTAAQWLLNAALSANPIGLIVIALVALAAGLYVAYRRSKTFRNIVNSVWQAVRTAATWVGEKLVAAFNLLWPILRKTPLLMIIRHFGDLIRTIRAAPGKIKSAASGMFDGIKNAFRSAINFVINGWNSLRFKIPGFDPPGPGPKFGGFEVGVPQIHPLAKGGIMRSAGLALVGERGPELLALPQGAGVSPLTGAGTRIEVPVYLDRRQIALAVADSASDQAARR